ncbi:uncharacterized protein HKW66_Vig0239470 [Vigna angularis]|uniref:Transposase-associated domain-containing protein n=1 Tax=Phaseolus angularis TaxID=3914 RepID=A0A8T0JF43_PHAAN|nr:uncharacterized protein HKW66_Vig0239470 [Vigna angularis]
MGTDRGWINLPRISTEYEKGVEDFIEFAQRNASTSGDDEVKFRCPCVNCLNGRKLNATDIREHLICDGFIRSYTTWIWHGELTDFPTVSPTENVYDSTMDMVDEAEQDNLEDMIRDVGAEAFSQAHVYETMSTDAETPLYTGSTKFTRLSAVLRLMNLKASNGWSDKSFTELLSLLNEMLPDGNTLPNRNYDAKKILCPMGMEYKRIHACPNDCILYRNENEVLIKCPKCGLSRYKSKNGEEGGITEKNGSALKVVWYLPLVARLKRLFANPKDAKNLRWHADERTTDGMLRHPADSKQWKIIDQEFPQFGEECRNLRFGLATDGMNPFGNLSTNHSCWPVILIIYNLSPGLCMKRKYMMLSMLISGPKQPGNDIDVYLRPLVEDLKLLWVDGVEIFDAFASETFMMHAMLFCTINDFPAYGNLSGYSVKGHKACPICEENTAAQQLKHGRKTVYMRHRQFLQSNHPYRRLKKAFNGEQEKDNAPIPLTGLEVVEKVNKVHHQFGKTSKKSSVATPWKKKSIFFDLPYWSKLDVRHCIDVMHVEKNVCDSLIGTLLNIQGKTKDGVNARLDLVDMKIREELAPREIGKRTYLPPACYTMSKQEKISFCLCLKSIKVPQGYSSNIKSLVSMQDLKLVGLKSHDCHVLMQQLLPVAIRGILPKKVRLTITRLCSFFSSICSKVIDPTKLDELQNEIIIILCQLEMFFPPSFFDIMVHLLVHLVREIKLCGPVYLRWMYPIERYMKILKGYVKNQYRPEGSMIERYIAEESIEFCSEYMAKANPIGVPRTSWLSRYSTSKSIRGVNVVTKSREELMQAHLYILNNTDEVIPFLEAHKVVVRDKYPRQSEKWQLMEHNRTFLSWFKSEVSKESRSSETLFWLANGLKFDVVCCTGYEINNCTFYTKTLDDKSTVQNSGVSLEAESLQFSTSKDQNPVVGSMRYYGRIEEIFEVDYTKFSVALFKCKWVDNKSGVKIDESGMTLVDFRKVGYREEPFIMAYQASQVFYVKDPASDHWYVALQGKRQIEDKEENLSYIHIADNHPFKTTINLDDDPLIDDIQAIREDHNEGIYI